MRSRIALVVAAVLVLALGIGGVVWWRQREAARDTAARAAVTAYAKGWSAKDLGAVPFQDAATRASFAPTIKDLGDAKVAVTTGDVERDGDSATSTLSVRWTLPCDVPWSYAVPVRLVNTGGTWAVATPTTGTPWHPDLEPGQTFQEERTSGDGGVGGRAREGRRREQGVAGEGAGQGHGIRLEGADPRDHLPGRRLGAAQGPDPGAQGRHRPDRRAAAGPDPHLRPAAAGHLRRGHGRDGRRERRPVPGR